MQEQHLGETTLIAECGRDPLNRGMPNQARNLGAIGSQVRPIVLRRSSLRSLVGTPGCCPGGVAALGSSAPAASWHWGRTLSHLCAAGRSGSDA